MRCASAMSTWNSWPCWGVFGSNVRATLCALRGSSDSSQSQSEPLRLRRTDHPIHLKLCCEEFCFRKTFRGDFFTYIFWGASSNSLQSRDFAQRRDFDSWAAFMGSWAQRWFIVHCYSCCVSPASRMPTPDREKMTWLFVWVCFHIACTTRI